MPAKGRSIRSALWGGNNWTGLPLVVWMGLAAAGWWWWMRKRCDAYNVWGEEDERELFDMVNPSYDNDAKLNATSVLYQTRERTKYQNWHRRR